MIFINFKTYLEGTGRKALELVRICSLLQAKTKLTIVPVLQAVDLRSSMVTSNYEVWIQNVDPIEPGMHTGGTLPEAVVEAGASGTFLNHSECKAPSVSSLEKTVARCKLVLLKTLIFSQDLNELKKTVTLKPTLIAYEPPELIASQETSVAKADPKVIKEAFVLTKASGIPLIVGAGVKDKSDVKKSMELGASGVAVSSAVLLSKDPEEAILELAKGFER